MTHFSDEGDLKIVIALEGLSDVNRIESSATLKSLRIGPRESLKLVRQMIKLPIKLLKDEQYFEVTRVIKAASKAQDGGVLTIADFSEIRGGQCQQETFWGEEQRIDWVIAMTSPKLIKLVRLAHSEANSKTGVWQVKRPSEGTSLRVGKVSFEA